MGRSKFTQKDVELMSDPNTLADNVKDSVGGSARAHRVVLIGDTAMADRVALGLVSRVEFVHLKHADERGVVEALTCRPSWIVIMMHDDVLAIQCALICAHVAQGVPMIVTIFDKTIGRELPRLMQHCEVTSPAELALPELIRLCMGAHRDDVPVRPGRRHAGLVASLRFAASTGLTHLTGFTRTTEGGARILMLGLVGLAAVLLADALWLVLAYDLAPSAALFEAVRVVTTVGPAAEAHGGLYALFAALAMLVTVIFTAMFTAGVVDRSLGPRLQGLIGPRSIPRQGHVIVVGLGQVGARLCEALRSRQIPVIAVERDPTAVGLKLVRPLRIPTIVGHGVDRALLERARLHKATAIAAVGSTDLDNISVAIAAHGVAPQAPIVLRAGEQGALSQLPSLLALGAVCDVPSLAAAHVIDRILGDL